MGESIIMKPEGVVSEVSASMVFEVLKRRRRIAVASMLLVVAAFTAYALYQPDVYRAEALLAVEPGIADRYVRADASAGANDVGGRMWLIEEHLLAPPVLKELIQDFNLYRSRRDRNLLDRMKAAIQTAQSGLVQWLHPYDEAGRRMEQNLKDLRSRIDIHAAASDAFSVAFEWPDNQVAMKVTNWLAELLIRRTSAANIQRVEEAAGFLGSEAQKLKSKLDQQNRQIQEHQRRFTNHPLKTATDLKQLETAQIQLHSKTEQIAQERARRVTVLEEMKELTNRGALQSEEPSAADSRLEELQLQLKQLTARYTDQHPEVRSVQQEIRDLRARPSEGKSRGVNPAQLRYMQLKAELSGIEDRLGSYRKQEEELASKLSIYRENVDFAPEDERTLANLIRDYELTRAQYETALERRNQALLEQRLNTTSQEHSFRIVRSAYLPVTPYAPSRVRIVLLGIAAGLATGFLLAVFAQHRDTSYHNPEEFANSSSIPILTAVPLLGAPRRLRRLLPVRPRALAPGGTASKAACLVTANGRHSIAAEQYSVLALQVRRRLGEDPGRVLAVTSAAGGEGKTVTSLNLAVALSRMWEGGVLLLEGDVRRPSLGQYLRPPRETKGLTDLLSAPGGQVSDCIWRFGGLSIISGGPLMRDPLSALSSATMRNLLAGLRAQFQFIVVDSPAILPAADSHVLAELADGVLLVVRAQRTHRELLEYALRDFRAPNILGAVLNGVDLRRSRYGYAYDYYGSRPLPAPPKEGAQRS